MIKTKIVTFTGNAKANTPLDITVNAGLASDQTILSIAKRTIAGDKVTTNITFADFTTQNNFRVLSSIDQAVTVTATVYYK